MKFSVIIPVYNEEGNIGPVVRKVREVIGQQNELLVVDDGSTDDTLKELDPNICTILRHNVNKGKGQAMKTGIAAVKEELTLFIGGDGQDEPKEIPILLDAIKGGADFVIGSRFKGNLTDGSITPINFLGNKFLTVLFNIIFGAKLTDTQAEFKCIRTEILKNMKLESNRYEIETELIIRALRKRCKIVEVPVSRYRREHGISNLYQVPLGRIKFGVRVLKTIIKGILFWR